MSYHLHFHPLIRRRLVALLEHVKLADHVPRVILLNSLMYISLATSAFAESKLPVNIEAGEAEERLMQFALETNLSIVFDPSQLEGITTNRVEGELLPSVALERMLEGSQLVSDQDEETGAFAVTRIETPPDAQANINSTTSITPMNKNERFQTASFNRLYLNIRMKE